MSGGEILLSGKVSGSQEVQFGDGELGIAIISPLEPKKHRSNAPCKKRHIIIISNRRSHDLWKGGTKYQPVGVMNLESDLLAFHIFEGGLIMGINEESDCVSMFPTERKKTDHLALNLDSESPILIEFKPVSLRKQE